MVDLDTMSFWPPKVYFTIFSTPERSMDFHEVPEKLIQIWKKYPIGKEPFLCRFKFQVDSTTSCARGWSQTNTLMTTFFKCFKLHVRHHQTPPNLEYRLIRSPWSRLLHRKLCPIAKPVIQTLSDLANLALFLLSVFAIGHKFRCNNRLQGHLISLPSKFGGVWRWRTCNL